MPFLTDELVTKEKWQKNLSLKNYSAIKIGGTAKYFTMPTDIDGVKRAISIAKQNSLKYYILGGGSKSLFASDFFNGLIISTANLNSFDYSSGLLQAQSGAKVGKIIEYSLKNGLGGLEFLYTVPCSLGGAIKMNAGAFGYQTADLIESVTIFDGEKVTTLNKQDCNFSYRNSNLGDCVILSATLRLVKDNGAYGKCRYYKLKRQCRQPMQPSLGSVFKNPVGLSAGNLIEECGLKGLAKGGAVISPKHANFIVNKNQATFSDFIYLKEVMLKAVYDKFKIKLLDEVIYIGE